MSRRRRPVDPVRQQMLKELTPIVMASIQAYGHEDYSKAGIGQNALPQARLITAEPIYHDWLTLDALKPIITRHIPKRRGQNGLQPLLLGFEFIALPARLAIPPEGMEEIIGEDEDGEYDDEIPWKEIALCTLDEVKRNAAMRRVAIRGSQAILDLLDTLIAAAVDRGGRGEQLMKDILAQRDDENGEA